MDYRWIGTACGQSPGKRLANIVMNFHGDPGQVHVGEASPEIFPGPGKSVWVPAEFNDIDIKNVGTFSALRSYTIGTVWFHSCALAGGQAGKQFCRQLALNAQCRVVAPEETQTEWWAFLNVLFMPRGCIDDYEGKVYLWLPTGEQRDFDPNGGKIGHREEWHLCVRSVQRSGCLNPVTCAIAQSF